MHHTVTVAGLSPSGQRSPLCNQRYLLVLSLGRVLALWGINPGIPKSRDHGPFVNPEIPGFERPNSQDFGD